MSLAETAMRPDESYRIHHRVRLPDGREVEVVHLDAHGLPSPGAADPAGAGERPAPPLHLCFHCASELVHPVEWVEEDEESWRILLRCPECEATREGVFDREQIDALERQLDLGIGSLISDLQRMTHTNMSEEIDFFVRALQADVILPSDF